MKKFMDKNFLLDTKTAQELYHKHAANQPIFDYHCHLIPQQIAENKKFANLTEIWLGGDHYKWRQMRTAGFSEDLITGNADPYDKFMAWAETIEGLIGNPLYHWTHLELQRYFGIYEPLTRKSAPAIWEKANKMLQSDELSVKGIFKKFKIHAVGTTDDPIDSLEYHKAIAAGTAPIGKIETKVLPSYRPDKALNIHLAGFADYIKKLAEVSEIEIKSTDDVIAALVKRLDFFVEMGCKASDHALEYPPFVLMSDKDIDDVFKKAMKTPSGEKADITKEEADAYRTKVLSALAEAYAERNIAMQLHFASIRDNNKKMFNQMGPDTGFDASHDQPMSESLSKLMSHFSRDGKLPKTILYTLNPKDYYPLGTLMGCFQGYTTEKECNVGNKKMVAGKVQLGSAWWFLDHKDGMNEQMKVLGNLGTLSAFIGMLTDSRSFLSYPRHEYFRRILCNLVGGWVENGEYPNDKEKLAEIINGISFENALKYFN